MTYWNAHPAQYDTIYSGGGCMLAALAHRFGYVRFVHILHGYAAAHWLGIARTGTSRPPSSRAAANYLPGFDVAAFWTKWRVRRVSGDLHGPTAERLLDVRTPAELAFSPDGPRLVFALHSTVADTGSFVPSSLWLVEGEGEPAQITSGAWSDRTPAWSPDGSRLAFLSDRITPGHQLPYTLTPGGEPEHAGTFVGSAESLAWSSDGDRLLVLVADPGCYGLDWSARAVTGAGPEPDPSVQSPGSARRRLFMLDLASGEEPRGRARGHGRVGVRLGRRRDRGGHRVRRSSRRVRMVPREDRAPGPERAHRAGALSADLADGVDRALTGRIRRAVFVEGYASDHGLLSGSLMLVNLADGTTTDPWPDLETVGIAQWCDDDSLWYGRTDGTGTACGRMWLDGRREERWRGDAFIGDEVTTPVCAVTQDAASVWTTHQAHAQPPELARFDHDAGAWTRFTSFNDDVVVGAVFPEARTIRWDAPDGTEIEGVLMTPRDANGPLPLIVCVHGGPTWSWGAYFSDSEPNAVLLADAGYACLLPNPRGSIGRGHAFAQGVIGDPGGIDYADIMAGVDRCIADGVADPIGWASPVCPTAATWPDGRPRRPTASAPRWPCPSSRTTCPSISRRRSGCTT